MDPRCATCGRFSVVDEVNAWMQLTAERRSHQAELANLRAVLDQAEDALSDAVRYHGSKCSAEPEDKCRSLRRYRDAIAALRELKGDRG